MTRNVKQGLDAPIGMMGTVRFRPDGKSGESCLGSLNEAACSLAAGGWLAAAIGMEGELK
ncbi:hypothetical protein CJO92_07320 [Ralstonia solanacearum]|uniref:Uncharacterized protein n=2 Tax=Ralstonia solanacearum species complex TaxID=3116862 RepID=A0AAD0WG15_RALSL|nr:hypothetical protein B0B51_05245 [blood disease bacterium A2-HR MARDI]AXV81381.1 hypothetical protein CJO77_07325 [Ralstonia solanacearum]AXW52516.1 hypothetical protein CJO92_07320 [Ralstonia solanacearum]